MRDRFFHVGQVVVRGRQELETEGGGRVRTCTHGSRPGVNVIKTLKVVI
jgi:hypothetical protein